MKYSFVAVLFAAAAYAKDSSSTASSASSTITQGPSYTPTAEEQCIAKCNGDDTGCKAKCVTVPNPNSSLVNALDQCMSTACVPKQTEAANNYQAYGDCKASCISEYYYNAKNTGGVPNVVAGASPTGGSNSGSGSNGSGSNGSGSNGSGSSSGNSTESGASGSGTATGTGAKASSTGAGNKLAFSMAGLVGAIGVAVLAL